MLFSEPKIPQFYLFPGEQFERSRFSALQRAENSSIYMPLSPTSVALRFSALQRAENSSMNERHNEVCVALRFSALQRAENSSMRIDVVAHEIARSVSVLFSEPKIPQWQNADGGNYRALGFSALQRAENSSIRAAH